MPPVCVCKKKKKELGHLKKVLYNSALLQPNRNLGVASSMIFFIIIIIKTNCICVFPRRAAARSLSATRARQT